MFLEGYTFNLLLSAPIVLSSVCFFALFRNKYSAKNRYITWNVICFLFLIPTNFYNFFLPKINFKPIQNIIIEKPLLKLISVEENPVLIPIVNSTNEFTISLPIKKIFFLIWICGILVYFLFQITRYYIYYKNVFRWSRLVTDEKILLLFDNIKTQMKIKKDISVYYSHTVTSPILIGCINPSIVLPNKINTKYLSSVFKHELLHYCYKDLWLQRLRLITRSLYWFNPFIWILCDLADRDMERACDAGVLNFSEKKKEYAEAIFYLMSLGMENSQPLITSFIKNKKEIFFRVEAIMDKKVFKKRGILFLVFVIITVVSANFLNIYAKPRNDTKDYFNTWVPLQKTLEAIDYEVKQTDNKTISATKNETRINFVQEENFNLKKNRNTYYYSVIEGIDFIKTDILIDMGYEIEVSLNQYFITENNSKILLDTNYVITSLSDSSGTNKEHNLGEYSFNMKIVKRNLARNEIADYNFENVNEMNYSLVELEEYVKANYGLSLKEYKEKFLTIQEKYPNSAVIEYIMLENGQIDAVIKTAEGSNIIESIKEIKNNVFYVEPDFY